MVTRGLAWLFLVAVAQEVAFVPCGALGIVGNQVAAQAADKNDFRSECAVNTTYSDFKLGSLPSSLATNVGAAHVFELGDIADFGGERQGEGFAGNENNATRSRYTSRPFGTKADAIHEDR